MIIEKEEALALIKNGDADRACELAPNEQGVVYIAIDRFDEQRVDHYIDRIEC